MSLLKTKKKNMSCNTPPKCSVVNAYGESNYETIYPLKFCGGGFAGMCNGSNKIDGSRDKSYDLGFGAGFGQDIPSLVDYPNEASKLALGSWYWKQIDNMNPHKPLCKANNNPHQSNPNNKQQTNNSKYDDALILLLFVSLGLGFVFVLGNIANR